MSTLLGNARIRIRPDMTGFESETKRGVRSAIGTATKVAAAAAAGAAAFGAVSIVKGSVQAASDLEQAYGGLEAVFKNNTAAMRDNAEAAKEIGLSQSQYANSATVLGAMLGNLGIEQDNLAGTTNDLIGKGADLAAMFGGSVPDAVDAITAALRGERDPIERYGISLNEAGIKAEMAATGASKAEATISLLNKQMEGSGAAGAAAREYDTFASSQQRLQANLENTKATLGEAFLPIVADVTAKFSELAEKYGPMLADKVKEIGEKFREFGSWVGDNVVPILKNVAEWLGKNKDIIIPTAAALGAMVLALKAYRGIVIAVTAVQAVLNAVMAANPIGLIVLAIAGLVAAFVALYQRNEGFRDFIQKIWQGIKDFMEPIIRWFAETIPPIWDKIWTAISTAMSGIWSVIQTVWNFIYPFVSGYLKLLFTAFTTVWGTIFNVVSTVMQTIWNVIKTVWDFIYPAVSTYLKLMWTVYSTIFKAVWSVVSTVMKAIWAVISAIWGVIGPFITGVLKEIWNNIQSTWNVIWTVISTVLGWIWDKIQAVFNIIKGHIENVMAGIRWIWDNVLSGIWNKAVEIFDKVRDKISGALDRIKELFSDAVGAIGRIWDRVTEIVKAPINAMFRWINDNMIDPINNVLGVFSDEIKLGNLPTFHSGGYTGDQLSGTEGIALLRNDEFVVNPAATRRNRAFLEALNDGMSPAAAVQASDAAVMGYGIGGPLDFIGAAIGQITDWVKQGAAFALNKVIDPALGWLADNFGGSWAPDVVIGIMQRASDAIKDWGKGEDDKRAAAAAVAGSSVAPYIGPISGGLGYPLPIWSVTSEFRGPGRPNHMGIDLGASTGTPVYAAAAGAVLQSLWNGGYGNFIRIDHGGGLQTTYGHLSALIARAGQIVNAGTLIGLVGSTGDSTGPHLHFEVLQNGAYANPRNYLAFDSGGMLPPGWSMAYNGTGKPEPVLTDKDWKTLTDGQTGASISITNYYPQAEPTSTTTSRALRMLSLAGSM